jgi:hypothetical protein
MPDWLPGVIVGFIAGVVTPLINGLVQRRKTDASARHENARAGLLIGESYDGVIETLREERVVYLARIAECEARQEVDREVIELLMTQKMSAQGTIEAMRAKLAVYEGGIDAPMNGDVTGEQPT